MWQIHSTMLMRLNPKSLHFLHLLKSYSVWNINVKKSAILGQGDLKKTSYFLDSYTLAKMCKLGLMVIF